MFETLTAFLESSPHLVCACIFLVPGLRLYSEAIAPSVTQNNSVFSFQSLQGRRTPPSQGQGGGMQSVTVTMMRPQTLYHDKHIYSASDSLLLTVAMIPASTILFPLIGKNYEAPLCKLLRSAGHHILEEEDCGSIWPSSSSFYSTVIVDIDNISCVSAIIQAAHTSVQKPKIVLLTSLLTWCGEAESRVISDPNTDFCTRIPLHCARKSYDLENALWNAALDSLPGDGNTYFVGTGLLYGGSGWDFEESLRYQALKSVI